jgi:5,10-methylenetetrahydrofolate reductase
VQLSKSIGNLKFIKSIEVVPKKDSRLDDLIETRDAISEVVDVVTAPENPMGRAGIDPISSLYILTQSTDLIDMPHITPRDTNSLYIGSQILTAIKLGISNFFVIGGDPVSSKENSKEVRELDTMGTIGKIRSIMESTGARCKGAIGGALNPYREPEEQITRKKMEFGVNFSISQICYDASFLKKDWIKNRSFKLSLGFMPILKKSSIEPIKKMGVVIGKDTSERIEQSDDLRKLNLRLIGELKDELKEYIDGIHIMPMGDYKVAKDIMEIL